MNKLNLLLDEIYNTFNWQVFIGLELEFYLVNTNNIDMSNLFKNFLRKFPMCALKDETGENQFEIIINHTNDIANLISTTNKIKSYLIEEALRYDMRVDFSSKPYKSQPGSSLHVNISFYNQKHNIYAKNGSN